MDDQSCKIASIKHIEDAKLLSFSFFLNTTICIDTSDTNLLNNPLKMMPNRKTLTRFYFLNKTRTEIVVKWKSIFGDFLGWCCMNTNGNIKKKRVSFMNKCVGTIFRLMHIKHM